MTRLLASDTLKPTDTAKPTELVEHNAASCIGETIS